MTPFSFRLQFDLDFWILRNQTKLINEIGAHINGNAAKVFTHSAVEYGDFKLERKIELNVRLKMCWTHIKFYNKFQSHLVLTFCIILSPLLNLFFNLDQQKLITI